MSSSGSPPITSAADAPPRSQLHVIDQLIRERAPVLLGHPLLGALSRPLLYPLLGYREAVRASDEMSRVSGFEAMALLSGELGLDIRIDDPEVLSSHGAALIVGNHPTGIADGVVVFDALSRVRRDFAIFANRDAIRAAPSLLDLIIPVEWVSGRRTRARTRETLRATQRAFQEQRAVVMFPSGRLAYLDQGRLRERPWMSTAVALARRHQVPIIPMHIEGRNSNLFYLFSRLSDQLRDITLFHELMNKRGASYRVRFGEAIPASRLTGDAEHLTAALQAHVESGLEVPFRQD